MKIVSHDDIPFTWYLQPTLYCGLLGYNRFVVVWFEFFTKELKWVEMELDGELYQTILEKVAIWWQGENACSYRVR